ncbi:MAG: DUF1566 domain-containing protein [Chitinophagaceae bacterium]|nr:DUF1566 domain-containing protein [Chitinophagaceae bacterium]
MKLKIRISLLLVILTSLVYAQKRLPTNEEVQQILNKTFNYPATIGKLLRFQYVTINSISLQLSTNTYYKALVEGKVLKVVSKNNYTYTYDINEPYRKRYVISVDKIKLIAKVKTLVLTNAFIQSIQQTNQNEAKVNIETQYECSPFYDPLNFPKGPYPGGLFINTKLIYENGIWKFKDFAALKKRINTVPNLQPENNIVLQVRNNSITVAKDTSNIIGTPKRLGNIEIAEKDFPNKLSWDKAKEACAELGNGWRLPTKDELNEMYKNRVAIGGFTLGGYWSSTEFKTEVNNMNAWYQFFGDGDQDGIYKPQPNAFRPVRSF